jgi:hypothetical protein
MIYLAIGSDIDENLRPFWFLKPGQSSDPLRRMCDLRMNLLKAWDCYWLPLESGGWIMLDSWLQAQGIPTYPLGAKKFGGYTEAIGRFYSLEQCLDAARDLVARADALPLRYNTDRNATEPFPWSRPAPVGLLG